MQHANAGINLRHGLIKMSNTPEILDLNLAEAARELALLRSRFKACQCDEAEFAVLLKGVFWHLRAAWNGRHLSFEDVEKLSIHEFDGLGTNPINLPGEPPI